MGYSVIVHESKLKVQAGSMSKFHKTGYAYKGFEVKKVRKLEELGAFLIELIHLETGAEIVHIECDDPENVFCLSFRTYPENSGGVAHILEHIVLCGSQKYPIKDPFFSMQGRSLNTYMNALTGSDFTCYPAASQIPQDFYNLLDVYVDAVFHPKLERLSFLQEGHRLEFQDPKDPSTPLQYKGIVFNEMKGSLTSSSARLSVAVEETLFPDLTYCYNSGGDPKQIPQLTHHELVAFHKTFYHPSRCLYFFYGNMPLKSHLDYLSKNVLKGVEKKRKIPPIPKQPRFNAPKEKTFFYPIAATDEVKNKTIIALAFLTCSILEQEDLLALFVLLSVLMDTDASALKKALLESHLCTQASVLVESEISEIPIVFTMRGCEEEYGSRLEKLILDTLAKVAKEGIEEERIEDAIYQLEFYRSEITGDSYPFGLILYFRSCLVKQHGGEAEDGLVIHELFGKLRKRIEEDPKTFSKLIEKYFLENPHVVRVTMAPDPTLEKKENEEEKKILQRIQEGLSEKEKKTIVKQAQELQSFQKKQEEESLECLPMIGLTDIPLNPQDFPLKKEKHGSLNVYHHDCFTNEILYATLYYDLPAIEVEDIPYLRLFSSLTANLGMGGKPYEKALEIMHGNLGGIGASITMHHEANDFRKFTPAFCLKAKALHRKAYALFPIMQEITGSQDFTDKKRLKELILQYHTSLAHAINSNALRYAWNLSAENLNVACKMSSHLNGLSYFYLLKDLAAHFDERADFLIHKLQAFQKTLFLLPNADLVLSCNQKMYDICKGQDFYGFSHLPQKPCTKWKGDYPLITGSQQARIIASPVAFIAQAMNAISYTHPDSPSLLLAPSIMENNILHKLIREVGGAYGASSGFHPINGQFYFYSYRDPNILSTLQAFEKAIETLAAGDFSEDNLREAKLEVIQNLDTPVSPGSRGDMSYGRLRSHLTLAMRKRFRENILSSTKEQVKNAVQNHILKAREGSFPAVFAGKELIERENEKLKTSGLAPFHATSI